MPDIGYGLNQTAVNKFTAASLVAAQNITGTGNIFTAVNNGGGFGAGFYMFKTSGNSASADFLGSMDASNWVSITSLNGGVNATATGQWSGFFPYIAARVTWNSGGTNTGTVTLDLFLK